VAKKESKEAIKYRVRLFRKREREALKKSNAFIWGLKSYFRARDLTNEWALARDVYKSTEVLSLQIPFESFMEGIVGNKKKSIKPIRSIEVTTLIDSTGESIWLIRPQHVPTPRRKK
jgi:hypothetical protein